MIWWAEATLLTNTPVEALGSLASATGADITAMLNKLYFLG